MAEEFSKILLQRKDVEQLTGWDRNKVQRLFREGAIRSFKVGHLRYTTREELDRYINERLSENQPHEEAA